MQNRKYGSPAEIVLISSDTDISAGPGKNTAVISAGGGDDGSRANFIGGFRRGLIAGFTPCALWLIFSISLAEKAKPTNMQGCDCRGESPC
jgi:hypothetical protein